MASEIDRLVQAIEDDGELRRVLTGFDGTFDGLVGVIRARGFEVTSTELAELLCCVSEELPDALLDQVCGGTGMTSMGLQQTVQRSSRAVQTLSNVMGTISGTQGTLIDNLK